MRIISCDNCGVVIDGDKVKWPEMYDDEGELIEGTAEWDGDRFVPVVPCPVCKEEIAEEGGKW